MLITQPHIKKQQNTCNVTVTSDIELKIDCGFSPEFRGKSHQDRKIFYFRLRLSLKPNKSRTRKNVSNRGFPFGDKTR